MKRLLGMGLLTGAVLLSGCGTHDMALDDISKDLTRFVEDTETDSDSSYTAEATASLDAVPSASELPLGADYIELNDNIPFFTNEELESTEPYMEFGTLDALGRVQVANALLDESLMPADTHERGGLGHVTPTGWMQNARGDAVSEIVEGGWLYNRSHLVGNQMAGDETDVEENLMTGTRQFNVNMIPFENFVADTVEQGTQVRYRVTPVFEEGNLLSHGVVMEGFSLDEDGDLGDELTFNIFVPNEQDGIELDYTDGSWEVE